MKKVEGHRPRLKSRIPHAVHYFTADLVHEARIRSLETHLGLLKRSFLFPLSFRADSFYRRPSRSLHRHNFV